MSQIEEYVVDNANELSDDMLELLVHPRPGSNPPSAVSRILLVKGATNTTHGTGVELGAGATINLRDNDFVDACDNIGEGTIVSYSSETILTRRPPTRATIAGFTFPMAMP